MSLEHLTEEEQAEYCRQMSPGVILSCAVTELISCMICCCCCLVAQLCLTLCDPMNCSCQAPLSMEFPKQGYWSGLPFPSPGDLPNPGIKPGSPALQADSLPTELQGKPIYIHYYIQNRSLIRTYCVAQGNC